MLTRSNLFWPSVHAVAEALLEQTSERPNNGALCHILLEISSRDWRLATNWFRPPGRRNIPACRTELSLWVPELAEPREYRAWAFGVAALLVERARKAEFGERMT